MSNVAIIGAQWGDEGKGKIVDLFTHDADIIVRFQGGNNAGHTLGRQRQKDRPAPGPFRRAASRTSSASSATAWSSIRKC